MTPDSRPSESGLMVQEHPLKPDFVVVSQPGRVIELRVGLALVLALHVSDTDEPWLLGALERAIEHARQPEDTDAA
jgi:hypothetical protein